MVDILFLYTLEDIPKIFWYIMDYLSEPKRFAFAYGGSSIAIVVETLLESPIRGRYSSQRQKMSYSGFLFIHKTEWRTCHGARQWLIDRISFQINMHSWFLPRVSLSSVFLKRKTTFLIQSTERLDYHRRYNFFQNETSFFFFFDTC